MEESDYCRAEVKAFAVLMEGRLLQNDWKGGWKHDKVEYFLLRLMEEAGELVRACRGSDSELVGKEAADVANFALMIADVAGSLRRMR